MNNTKKGKIMVTCAKGLGKWLALEIKSLGYPVLAERPNGVDTETDWHGVMELNYKLRSALCVLYLLKTFQTTDPKKYYESVKNIPWEEYIPEDGYVSIVSRTNTPNINNTMYVNQLTKDAIVDRMAEKTGKRPDSGADRDKIVVNIYWHEENCWVYLNTSGNKLADRNYRKIPFKAPLQESLAASILMATGYDGSQNLVLPMCGSGTFAIEAALMALNRDSGSLRVNYSFMHLKDFDSEYWKNYRNKALKSVRKSLPKQIIATDIDPEAIEASKKNAKTAGVDHLIEFQVCDFAETPIPEEEGGIILMNPEYGERLGEIRKLEGTYRRIGDFLKQKCKGHTGYIFTGNLQLAKTIGLQTSKRTEFYNAKIECRLLKYEIYSGSKKLKYNK